MRATLLHRWDPQQKRGAHRGRSAHGDGPGATARRPASRPVRTVVALAGTVVVLLGAIACSRDPAPGAEPASSGGAAAANGAAPGPGATVAPGPVEPAPGAPGSPGEPISVEPIEAPAGGRAWRVSHHSTGAGGADIAVSAVVLVPDGPPPAGGFPLVTWAHPTTGAADGCQPSLRGVAGLPYSDELLARGWAVVATDYEGLGSAGPHPYLVGASEGHAVLDAARAAARLPDTGVTPDSPVVIWGFSQGGHAAAFAGELAPAYAPELAVVGVAVAAPVSDVAGFTRRAEQRNDQLGVVLTIVNGFAAAYPELDPAAVLTAEGRAALEQVEHRCIGEINEFADRPVADIIAVAPTEDPAFAARFAENRAGDAPIGVPVLVVQGADDDIVDPAATAALVDRYCALGVPVRAEVRPGVGHGVLAPDPFLGWIGERLAGAPATSTC